MKTKQMEKHIFLNFQQYYKKVKNMKNIHQYMKEIKNIKYSLHCATKLKNIIYLKKIFLMYCEMCEIEHLLWEKYHIQLNTDYKEDKERFEKFNREIKKEILQTIDTLEKINDIEKQINNI